MTSLQLFPSLFAWHDRVAASSFEGNDPIFGEAPTRPQNPVHGKRYFSIASCFVLPDPVGAPRCLRVQICPSIRTSNGEEFEIARP